MGNTLKQKILTGIAIAGMSLGSLFNGGCAETTPVFKNQDGCYYTNIWSGNLFYSPTCTENYYDMGPSLSYFQGADGRVYLKPNVQRNYPSPEEKIGTDVATWGLINALTGQ